MALLDEIPADILLDVLEYLPKDQGDPRFYSLQRLAGTSSKLRQCLLPLLYKDVLFECEIVSVDSNGDHIEEHDTAESEGSQEINRIRHNAYLAQSADGPGYAHRVLMLVNEFADPDEIVRIVRDEMDVGNAAKWPNLRSYAYIYSHRHVSAGHSYSTSQVAKRLEKELPVLKQAPIISGSIAAFSPSLPASFLAQLTSLTLSCDNQGIDANYLPKFFAPTLVRLKFVCVRPENIWNIFYDGQNKRSVVFANLRRLDIAFENPRRWEEDYMDHDELPSSKGNLIDRDLAKMSLWTTKTLGKLADYRIPSFPQLESFRCDNLIYSFRELASHIQCQSSLRNLYVANRHLYFDFDPSRFENLERVEFRCISDNLDNASNTGFPHHSHAFSSILSSQSSMRKLVFHSFAGSCLLNVPSTVGCTKLQWLQLRAEVDFNSILHLTSQLPNLFHLDLGSGNGYYIANDGSPEAEDILAFGDLDFKTANKSLRRFVCYVGRPKSAQFYTTAYAMALALRLSSLAEIYLVAEPTGDLDYVKIKLSEHIGELPTSSSTKQRLLSATLVDHTSVNCDYLWLFKD